MVDGYKNGVCAVQNLRQGLFFNSDVDISNKPVEMSLKMLSGVVEQLLVTGQPLKVIWHKVRKYGSYGC